VAAEALLARGQSVKSMASLVQQRDDIALHAHRVHENERQPGLIERRLVAAGRLALATLQIKQAVGAEQREQLPESGIEPVKYRLRLRHKLVGGREWLEGRTIFR